MNNTKELSFLILISLTLFTSGCQEKIIAKPQNSEENFTEFYIFGPEGKTDNYPTEYTLGEKGTVVVGIVNHEYKPVNYTLELRLENKSLPLSEDLQKITLAHNQTWEKPVTFTPTFKGNNMKLEFLLFKETDKDLPYRNLKLWINVTENM
jgi:uncharacterized membrane protein